MSVYHYRARPIEDGAYVLTCVELDVAAEGQGRAEALSNLKKAILERLTRPDAVAPPSNPAPVSVSLVEERSAPEDEPPQGPGEA